MSSECLVVVNCSVKQIPFMISKRFMILSYDDVFMITLENYNKLQGSQTFIHDQNIVCMFDNYHNLQGSQTSIRCKSSSRLFENYHNLQGSQTTETFIPDSGGLRTIIIYRALKRQCLISSENPSLRTIIIYRALKRPSAGRARAEGLRTIIIYRALKPNVELQTQLVV